MKNPDYFNLLIAPEQMRIRGAGWLRTAIVAAFVGLIALFFTAPVGEAPSLYDTPLPMPSGVEDPIQTAR